MISVTAALAITTVCVAIGEVVGYIAGNRDARRYR